MSDNVKEIIKIIEELEEFFKVDMWFASNHEWRTEHKMLKYLDKHFKICKDDIRKLKEK